MLFVFSKTRAPNKIEQWETECVEYIDMKIAATILISCSVILLLVFPAAAQDAMSATRLVALVGERPITLHNVTQWLKLRGTDISRATDAEWQEAIFSAIDRAVLVGAAEHEKIEVTPQEVQKEIAERRKREQAYVDKIQLLGLTEEEEHAEMREQLLIDRLLARKLGMNVFVPPSALKEWYARNKDLLARPEGRVCRVISAPDQAKIENLRTQLLEGASFDELAKKESSDPWAQKGGLMEPLRRGDGSVFTDAAFQLEKIGDISATLETPIGFHLLKLEQINHAEPPQFDDVRDLIRKKVLEETRSKLVPAFARELRARTSIRIILSQLPLEQTTGR